MLPTASPDTSAFTVAAELDSRAQLTHGCAAKVCSALDTHGVATVTGLLSPDEADRGAKLLDEALGDPERARAVFASETDSRYLRRDFCALPTAPSILSYASLLCSRLQEVLTEYCGRSRSVLELSTLTSYDGCSHQYIHRDPPGVLTMFVAVEDVSLEQGGTAFIPGTHLYSGSEWRLGGRSNQLMNLYRLLCNIRVLKYNIAKLWSMRTKGQPDLAPGEFMDRVFSRSRDNHQPNLLRFLTGKSDQFHLLMLRPKVLWKLLRDRASIEKAYQLVQAAPRKGTVILYRSDLMHAGPDNVSKAPRRFFSLSIARDVIHPQQWHEAYSVHTTLAARPLTLGQLLEPEGMSTGGRNVA